MVGLSYSRMRDSDCPFRFNALHIAKSYKEPETPEMRLGNEVHSFLAEYERYCLMEKVGRAPMYFWGNFDKWKNTGKWTNPERAKELCEAFEKSEFFEIHVPAANEWAFVEQQMSFDIDLAFRTDERAWFDTAKTEFRMICDVVYRSGDTIHIVDHKTGFADPDPLQLDIAAFLIARAIPALQMGGVFYIDRVFNVMAGFPPAPVHLPVLSMDELAPIGKLIKDRIAVVHSWKEYPAQACWSCKYCTVPGCPIREDVEKAIVCAPGSPVISLPTEITNLVQAQKAVDILRFMDSLSSKVQTLLKAYVEANGPVSSNGARAELKDVETLSVKDLKALVGALSAWKASPELIWQNLSLGKTNLEKIIKKASLDRRRPAIAAMTEMKSYKKFQIVQDKFS